MTERKVQQSLVAFGANERVAFSANAQLHGLTLGQTIRAAAQALAAPDVIILKISRLFSTPCFPPGAGPDYVNAAALIQTTLPAPDLLAWLHRIEVEFGRERVVRWGQRSLDIDLLAMGDQVLPDAATHGHWRGLPAAEQSVVAPDQLILPHPRLQDRAFVLVPLADVAPDWRHPILGLTVLEMLAALDSAEIAAITPL